jgi:lysophospholipase L1-like esterase
VIALLRLSITVSPGRVRNGPLRDDADVALDRERKRERDRFLIRDVDRRLQRVEHVEIQRDPRVFAISAITDEPRLSGALRLEQALDRVSAPQRLRRTAMKLKHVYMIGPKRSETLLDVPQDPIARPIAPREACCRAALREEDDFSATCAERAPERLLAPEIGRRGIEHVHAEIDRASHDLCHARRRGVLETDLGSTEAHWTDESPVRPKRRRDKPASWVDIAIDPTMNEALFLRRAFPPLIGLICTACGADGAPTSIPRETAQIILAPPPAQTSQRVCAPLSPRTPIEIFSDPPPPIEGDLGTFFEALARLARGNASTHVRIAAFGDSNLTMDYPTGHLRRILQTRYADGGHGFVALGQPWSHYQHMDVVHGIVSGWRAYAITTSPVGDGLYGLGGIAVENQWQGSHTMFATAKESAPVGRSASHLGVFYLKRKRGGDFVIEVDRRREVRVSTNATEPALGYHEVQVPLGAHRVDVVSASAAPVRVFGGVLETDTPGVVIDSFGVGAMNSKTLAKSGAGIFKEMLAARRYDLVIFMTGANDVFTMDHVPASLHEIMERIRAVSPNTSILVFTPADRGRHKTFPLTLKVVAQRREIASKEGVAFWNLFEAMGGENSMATFVKRGLAHDDAIHYTSEGGRWIAERFDTALSDAFQRYLSEHPAAGCASLANTD